MSWADDMDRDQVEHPECWGLKLDEMGNPVEADREWSGELTPLKGVEGTFSGTFDAAPPEWIGDGTEIQMLYMYGPDPNIRWWRHWFYRIREALTGEPYPTILLASGPATLSVESEEIGSEVIFTGSFRASGEWSLDPSLRDSNAEGESR